jgi:hypothetical protein
MVYLLSRWSMKKDKENRRFINGSGVELIVDWRRLVSTNIATDGFISGACIIRSCSSSSSPSCIIYSSSSSMVSSDPPKKRGRRNHPAATL